MSSQFFLLANFLSSSFFSCITLLWCFSFFLFSSWYSCYSDIGYNSLVLSFSYFFLSNTLSFYSILCMISLTFSPPSTPISIMGCIPCALCLFSGFKIFLFYGCDISSEDISDFFPWKFSSPSMIFHSICFFFIVFTWYHIRNFP